MFGMSKLNSTSSEILSNILLDLCHHCICKGDAAQLYYRMHASLAHFKTRLSILAHSKHGLPRIQLHQQQLCMSKCYTRRA